MATNPTRSQQKAGDLLAEALDRIAEAGRLDGGKRLDGPAWAEVVMRVCRVSSALGAAEIVPRALQRRIAALGLPAGTIDLLLLIEGDVAPRDMLLLDDEAFREMVAKADEELGGI